MLDDDYWMTAANIRPVLKIERNIVDVRAYAQHSFCFVPVVYQASGVAHRSSRHR
jgi:hypothetical protein